MAIKITAPKAAPAPILPPDLARDLALIQEQFPKIGDKISIMWGSVVLQQYLKQVIFDDRGGRQGFPLPVVTALMRLYEYHATLMPDQTGDNWEHIV